VVARSLIGDVISSVRTEWERRWLNESGCVMTASDEEDGLLRTWWVTRECIGCGVLRTTLILDCEVELRQVRRGSGEALVVAVLRRKPLESTVIGDDLELLVEE
jgi:hypothetical protein